VTLDELDCPVCVTLDELNCPDYVTLDELDCPVQKLRFLSLRHM